MPIWVMTASMRRTVVSIKAETVEQAQEVYWAELKNRIKVQVVSILKTDANIGVSDILEVD